MPASRTRKIVVTGVLAAVSILLGITRWGFIPWFSGASLTIMHVPVIIGAILEGPWVGAVIGLIFGLFSLIQAVIAPTGPVDVIFINPLVSILPRLFIGPLAWLAWRAVQRRWPVPALVLSGIAGSLTNSVLVLGMIGLLAQLNLLPALPIQFTWLFIGGIFVANSLAEIALSAIIVTIVIAAWNQIPIGKKQGADL